MKRSLRSWLWRVPLDEEVDEELALHVELRTRELIERGMDAKTARDMAVSRVGDMTRLKRTCVDLARKRDREMRLTQWLGELRDDVTFAIRQLRASPAFTLVAAITLALGIGANSAMFALADATLLRPLPFPDPERLVIVEERSASQTSSRIAPLNVREWNDQNRTFETMAGAFMTEGGGGPVFVGPDGTPEMPFRQTVTARFFDTLGVRPIAGRTFLPADETPSPTAVVLSEVFWRTRFGADPTLVGRDISLGGQPFTVIGVVPAQFQFLRRSDIWTLFPLPRDAAGRNPRNMQVIGRLKPGVGLAAARTDLNTLADALAQQFRDQRSGRHVTVEPFRDVLIGRELGLTSMLFLGVVGFVLLMCCANVANLLLARTSIRARELAVRSALGAGRRRIVGQLLTESLVLSALGGILGVGVGAAILAVAPALIPQGLLPGVVTLSFDARVVTFCAATSFLVGVLFGLVPAWQATGVSLVQALTSDGRAATRRGGRLRSLLVVAEIATAVLLLCGAGLLLRTLLALERFDPGYRADSERVLTMDFALPGLAPDTRYPTQESLLRFYDAAEREVAALPGVRSAGWASTLPLGNSQLGAAPFQIAGDAPTQESSRADYQIVSPGYFRTLDLPIVTGRAFTDRDTSGSVPVCIVNEAFVRRHLRGRNPVGIQVAIREVTQTQPVIREIVGVARQVKWRPDEPEDMVQVYVPHTQNAWLEAYLVVRPSEGSAEALAPAVRRAVARVDTELPIRNVVTLEDVSREATSRYRFRAMMVVTFAGLALLLAMVGVFGVLAYSVQQRSREFGIRIALGASTTHVLGLVLGSAARVIAGGAVIGLVAAAALGQSISTFLFGVPPLDLVTFTAVAVLLAMTAAIASAAPAFRAARVNPVVAFRNE